MPTVSSWISPRARKGTAMVDVAAGTELTTGRRPVRRHRPELQERYRGWFSTNLAERITASGSMGA